MNPVGASILSIPAALALLGAAPKPRPAYYADPPMRDAPALVPDWQTAGDPRGKITLDHLIDPDVP